MPTLKNNLLIFLALFITSLHFFRIGDMGFFTIYVMVGLILFSQIPIRFILSILFLIYSFFLWIEISCYLVIFRLVFHIPALRLCIILGTVILIQLIAIMVCLNSYTTLQDDLKKHGFSVLIFLAVFILLIFLREKIKLPILIFDRFGLRLGNLEAFFLGLYGAYLGSKFIDPISHYKIRKKIWAIFSIVFFTQLFLGLFVNKGFLMTGKLHFPIPALIIGGPLYRGGGYFMLGLFLSTILLVGPAWCSHLCYVGGLDAITSSLKKTNKTQKLPRRFAWFNLFITIFLALYFRYFHVSWDIVFFSVAFLGIISLIFIFFLSPIQGKMTHCISWCPLGLISLALGKISPFRMKVDGNKCKSCKVCVQKCPYQAIDFTHKAVINGYCTLCGDCIASCPHEAIHLSCLDKKNTLFYKIFLFFLVVLHILFLGLARI
jgi:ferredoxin